MSRFTPRERTFSVDLPNGDEAFVTVRMTSPGDHGRLSGPPERCYPPEPPEFEVVTMEVPDGVYTCGPFDIEEVKHMAIDKAFAADWTED